MTRSHPVVEPDAVVRLWLDRQGLSGPRGATALDRSSFVDHLERTGALQLDGVNVLDRAHYLTLWSRFGPYHRETVDQWVYRDRIAYEYWGHEASILPASCLPLSRRRMRRFPPAAWTERSWWPRYETSTASKRRVLRRLRNEGPLESADFERIGDGREDPGEAMPFPKEDRRSLKLLWHDGRVAVRKRRHFRTVYDLASRVYPEGPAASTREYEDGWLLTGLRGQGVASEAHLVNYVTAPSPRAAERKRILDRNLRRGTITEVRVRGIRGAFYATPETLDEVGTAPEPTGTHVLCPFDSFFWQRKRARQLLGFDYRLEIYTPASRRVFGYYVMPILHEGRLVGRLDPKLHRDRAELEIKSIHLEPDFRSGPVFARALSEALHSLATFVGAERVVVPRGWRDRL